MRSYVWLAATLAALTACHSRAVEEKSVSAQPQSAPVQAAPAPPARKAAIGDFGLDLTAMNPDVRPGNDFYAYANGKWLDSFNIPADRSSYGPFNKLEDAEALLPRNTTGAEGGGRQRLDVHSNFFEVTGQVRLGDRVLQER